MQPEQKKTALCFHAKDDLPVHASYNSSTSFLLLRLSQINHYQTC